MKQSTTISTHVTELITGLVTDLREYKTRVNQTISTYPSPITGCDAQFNHLLKERQLLTSAIKQLEIETQKNLTLNDTRALLSIVKDSLQSSSSQAANLVANVINHSTLKSADEKYR